MTLFCVDEDMPVALADWLNAAGHDSVAVKALPALRGSGDEAVFLAVVREGRTILSHNERHFMLLHRAWRHWPLPSAHSGVLLVPQIYGLPVEAVVQLVLQLLASGAPLDNRLYRLWRRSRVASYDWEEPYPG